jgi:PPE-repeat protein
MPDYMQMIQQYLPQTSNQQRNAITQALMNVQNPPPRSQMPQQPNAMTAMPAPGSTAPGQMTTPGAPGTSPLGPGVQPPPPPPPPTPGQGISPTPGLGPQSMGQTMQPTGMMPGGPNFGTPPLVGGPPQPQNPNMVPPPAVGSGQVY